MSIKIEELLNLHEDKTCHVVGHGPSLTDHISYLKSVDKAKDIIFSVNDVDLFTQLEPDFWLTTNPDYTVQKLYDRINKFSNTTFLFSDCYDHTDPDTINSLLRVKHYSFDSVHFNSEPNIFHVKGWRLGCQRGWINCCKNIIKDRLTLQEYLQKVSGFKYHYSTADTSILHALAFSVILGSKNIKIYGVDLNYNIGYVGGHLTGNNGATHGDSFDYWMDRILSDFYIINESAKLLNIKIEYYGFNDNLNKIINQNVPPEKIYESNCKEFN
jgi:hypothetical protein